MGGMCSQGARAEVEVAWHMLDALISSLLLFYDEVNLLGTCFGEDPEKKCDPVIEVLKIASYLLWRSYCGVAVGGSSAASVILGT